MLREEKIKRRQQNGVQRLNNMKKIMNLIVTIIGAISFLKIFKKSFDTRIYKENPKDN